MLAGLKNGLLLAGFGCMLFLLPQDPLLAGRQPPQVTFDRLTEAITRNCGGCHFRGTVAASAIALEEMVSSPEHARRLESDWQRVYARVVTLRSMPPAQSANSMSEVDRTAIRDWIDNNIPPQDAPTRSFLRRLSNYELNRSIRDIFGFDFDVGRFIQKDNVVDGFPNNAAVAFATRDRTQQYLAAAVFVSDAVLGLNDFLTTKRRYWGAEEILQENPNRSWRTTLGRFIGDLLVRVKEGQRAEVAPELNLREAFDTGRRKVKVLDLEQHSRFVLRHDFPVTGTYILTLHASAKGSRRRAAIDVAIDGVALPWSADLAPYSQGLNTYAVEVTVPRGKRSLVVSVPSTDRALLSSVELTGPILPAPLAELPCVDPAAAKVTELECARKSVHAVALIAFRTSTLGDDEVQNLLTPFRSASGRGADFRTALGHSMQAILMHPRFLYRIEFEPPTGRQGIEDHEFATRLSYFLWGTLPDEELRKLATRGTLNLPGTIQAQVRRMLGDSRAEALVDAFANGWLGFETLRNHAVDKRIFPQFDEHLRQDMLTETRLYLTAFFREDWPIRDVLDSDVMFLNERLAGHYGIENVRGFKFQRLQSPSGVRRGLLTHGSVLTLTSHSHGTSAVKRGLWIIDRVLCESVGEVPDVPSLEVASGAGALTLRQQMEKHRANPNCSNCHDKIDPPGFSLENYDGIGRWRTMDGGSPIDSSGSLQRMGEPVSFENFEGLRNILKDDDRFPLCATRKLMTYALGRSLSASDEAVVRDIVRNTQPGGHRIQDVLTQIALSDPFRGHTR